MCLTGLRSNLVRVVFAQFPVLFCASEEKMHTINSSLVYVECTLLLFFFVIEFSEKALANWEIRMR